MLATPELTRARVEFAPGSYTEFAKLTKVREAEGVPKAEAMIAELVAVFPAAEAGQDEATADLLTQRLQVHEKTAWSLRSLLE